MAIEPDQLKAAKRLIAEVYREYLALMSSREVLQGIIDQWKEMMPQFRAAESKYIISVTPSEKTLAQHKKVMNALILAAEATANACSRHLEVNYHLEDSEREKLQSEIELIKSQRAILALEFRDWTPKMPKADLDTAVLKFFGESPRKAA